MTHPRFEKTFVILKPDTIQRGLMGEILRRFERTGLKLVATKLTIPTEEQCWSNYNKDDVWFSEKGQKVVDGLKARGVTPSKEAIEYGKDILRANVKYMTCGPVLCMVLEGNQAVGIVKKLVGGTEPLTSDVGTIRGDLTIDSYGMANIDSRAVRNLVHCSDAPEEALREIQIWFSPKEILTYRHIQDEILYDVNLDGILE